MKDRTFERGQGCWNCSNRMSHEDMKKWWAERAQSELSKGVHIALSSKLGEQDPRVINLRRMISMIDHSVGQSEVIHCTIGITAKEVQVGDITPANYLCRKWNGMQGASIARQGGAPDKLVEELLDDDQPMTVSELVGSMKPGNDN